MKTFILNIIICIGVAGMAHAQSNSVTFLPGLRENATIWSGMSTQLQQQYAYSDRFDDFNGENAINTAANSVYIPNGEVIVGHSQGGLVAREYIRDRSPSDFKALISVGTPHTGAPIVNAVENGNVLNFFGQTLWDLSLGPQVFLGINGALAKTIDILNGLGVTQDGVFKLQTYLENKFTQDPGVQDMKPGSNFLSQLNAQPNNTLPAARYAIYGREYYQTPWHLLGSIIAGPGEVESNTGIQIHHYLTALYAQTMFSAFSDARYYKKLMDRARTNFNFQDYWDYRERWQEALGIAFAFKVGYDSLYYRQQRLWSKYVTGSLTSNGWYAEDGLLPAPTQAPSFVGTLNDQRLHAQGANHLEQTAHPSVRQRLEQALGNPDVNVPEAGAGDEPLGVAVSGPPYVNDGQTMSFSSDVSNAEGSISYQWYYRRESYSSWTSGGTGSSFQHTFYSAPGGETAHSAVKLKVTSAGETAADVHAVDVYGGGDCQNGLNAQSTTSDSMGTNVIIPCD